MKDYVAPLKLENYLDLIYQKTGRFFISIYVEDFVSKKSKYSKFFKFLELENKLNMNLSGLEKPFIPDEVENLRSYKSDESEDDLSMEFVEENSIIGFTADDFDMNIVTPKNSHLAETFVLGGTGNYTILNELDFETFMTIFDSDSKKILVYTYGRYYLYLFTYEKQIAFWARSYAIGNKYKLKNMDILDKEGNDHGFAIDDYNFTLELDDSYNFTLYGITVTELFKLDVSPFKKIPLYSLLIFLNPEIKEVIDNVIEIKKVVDKPVVTLKNSFGNSIILLLEEETIWSRLISTLNFFNFDLSGLYQKDYEIIETGTKKRRY